MILVATSAAQSAKEKTFFFLNYEGSRQRIGITGSGTVPSALERSEVEVDFSATHCRF